MTEEDQGRRARGGGGAARRAERSAVHFSFHPKGRPASEAEPPAGHSLIFGPTGGGKSVLLSLLGAQARRVDTRIFAFDYRRGLEWQIKTLDGSYTTITPDKPTGLNPLYAETDPTGQSWLSDWLAALLRRTVTRDVDLKEVASLLAELDAQAGKA